jgi:uncharacterized membrane protein YgdD (TMEM256/DUF423 family)
MKKQIVIAGSILILVAVILGAFGAHSLKELIKPEKLSSFEVGVRYQFYHGLGMLMIGFNYSKINASKLLFPIMLLGVLLFSVSIYLLSIQSVLGVALSFLGPVTPIGGLLLITSWLILIINLIKVK